MSCNTFPPKLPLSIWWQHWNFYQALCFWTKKKTLNSSTNSNIHMLSLWVITWQQRPRRRGRHFRPVLVLRILPRPAQRLPLSCQRNNLPKPCVLNALFTPGSLREKYCAIYTAPSMSVLLLLYPGRRYERTVSTYVCLDEIIVVLLFYYKCWLPWWSLVKWWLPCVAWGNLSVDGSASGLKACSHVTTVATPAWWSSHLSLLLCVINKVVY